MTKTRQWVMLTAGAMVVILAAGWFLLVKHERSKASGLRTDAATQQQANQVLLAQIAALQSEEKSLPAQQALLRKFSTQVPDNSAEPTMIRQLAAAAAGAGVDLVSMTPGDPSAVTASGALGATSTAAATPLMQLPVTLQITGTYPNVESYFQSLEGLPRALRVTGWTLDPAQSDSSSSTAKTLPPNSLAGTLNAVVYYAPPATATTGTTLTPTTGSTTAPAPTTGAATPAPTAPAS
jgi:Tfp pilus assembly protein PilO